MCWIHASPLTDSFHPVLSESVGHCSVSLPTKPTSRGCTWEQENHREGTATRNQRQLGKGWHRHDRGAENVPWMARVEWLSIMVLQITQVRLTLSTYRVVALSEEIRTINHSKVLTTPAGQDGPVPSGA